MKKILLVLCAAVMPQLHAATMASQPWTTNRIAEAESRISAQIAAVAPGNYATVSNRAMSAIQSHQDISGKADKTNTYTKAETDAKIVERAPKPGDYATVSNRAMMAITGNDLGAFAATGTVWRAESYGTPNRWTDATGCVWEVVANVWFDHRNGNIFVNGVSIFPSDTTAGDMKGYLYYDPSAMEYVGETGGGWYFNGENTSGTPSVLEGGPDATSLYSGNLTLGDLTNLVGRVALTNDIPDVSGYATPEDVTAAIREQSLGGIWDSQLEVWWTPIMQNGALRYVATTNVNLGVNQ